MNKKALLGGFIAATAMYAFCSHEAYCVQGKAGKGESYQHCVDDCKANHSRTADELKLCKKGCKQHHHSGIKGEHHRIVHEAFKAGLKLKCKSAGKATDGSDIMECSSYVEPTSAVSGPAVGGTVPNVFQPTQTTTPVTPTTPTVPTVPSTTTTK